MTVRARVVEASSADTMPVRLEELALDSSLAVRAGVAGNPRTPVPVLARLADDPTLSVQRGLLRNPATPEPVLIALIASTHSTIRFGVEAHPNAGPATCRAIATTGTAPMRINLAGRDVARDRAEQRARGRRPPPAPLTTDVVQILAADPDVLGREQAVIAGQVHPAADADRLAQQTRPQLPRGVGGDGRGEERPRARAHP